MFKLTRSHAPVLGVAVAALILAMMAPAAAAVAKALYANNAGKLDGLDGLAYARSSVVKTTHGGVGWLPYGSSDPTGLDRFISGVDFDAGGSMVLPLDGPGYQNRKTLGLAKVELCYSTTDTAIITSLSMYATEVTSAPLIYSDSVDRSSGTTAIKCDTLTINARVHKGVGIRVVTSGAGNVRLEGVRATWSAAAATGELPRQAGRTTPRANG